MKHTILLMGLAAFLATALPQQSFAEEAIATAELIKYGDFNSWVTRQIQESKIIGGKQMNVYAIGPTCTVTGSKPYTNLGGSPWASSNILAKVSGVTKTSNSVYPDQHPGHGQCAKLVTQFESCKVLGIMNIDVIVAGTIFLGEMVEPIKSTKTPYSKMNMGIPFTKHPRALHFDYKLSMPDNPQIVYSSGFGKKKTSSGHDKSKALILLQYRWEDDKGNIYAKRVGTGCAKFDKTTDWISDYEVPINYGDCSHTKGAVGLIPDNKCYYAKNSKGKMVPVHETGWAEADTQPTHLILLFSSGSGEAYVGTPGLTFWVDDVALIY